MKIYQSLFCDPDENEMPEGSTVEDTIKMIIEGGKPFDLTIKEVPYEEIRKIQGGPIGGDPTGCTTFSIEGEEQDILEYLNTTNGYEYETVAQAAHDEDFVMVE